MISRVRDGRGRIQRTFVVVLVAVGAISSKNGSCLLLLVLVATMTAACLCELEVFVGCLFVVGVTPPPPESLT